MKSDDACVKTPQGAARKSGMLRKGVYRGCAFWAAFRLLIYKSGHLYIDLQHEIWIGYFHIRSLFLY